MILGLSGYARTGKDSVADVLTNEFGFTRLAFADKLRESLYALNPTITWDYAYGLKYGAKSVNTVKAAVDELGWDGIKKTGWGKAARELLQRFGTEVGRDILGGNIWVDAAFKSIEEGKKYVFTDCRFSNEATAIQSQLTGQVWRINRPGVGPINDHVSEIGLDDYNFDKIIDNDGDLTDLATSVRLALKSNPTT